MASIATYPFDKQIFLAEGHTITGRPGLGVLPDSSMSEVLISRPFYEDEKIEIVHLGNGCHARILWVVPIYPSGQQYTIDHGFAALIEQFVAREVDVIDSQRPPIV